MRKTAFFALIMMLLLSGCQRSDKDEKEFRNSYNSFIDAIEDNKGAESLDIPFDKNIVITQMKDGTYHYKITIDNPKTAMYSIQALVMDRSMDGSTSDYPNIGLTTQEAEDPYSMIPYQNNEDRMFVKSITLEGTSTSPVFTLNVLVTWKDYAKLKTSSAYFNFTYDNEQAVKDAVEEEMSSEDASE